MRNFLGRTGFLWRDDIPGRDVIPGEEAIEKMLNANRNLIGASARKFDEVPFGYTEWSVAGQISAASY
jgi:hypothetical protein